MTIIQVLYLIFASILSGAVSGFVSRIIKVWLKNRRVNIKKKLDKKFIDEIVF
jgi:hypothetical protein